MCENWETLRGMASWAQQPEVSHVIKQQCPRKWEGSHCGAGPVCKAAKAEAEGEEC